MPMIDKNKLDGAVYKSSAAKRTDHKSDAIVNIASKLKILEPTPIEEPGFMVARQAGR